jgi:hypothetical protein
MLNISDENARAIGFLRLKTNAATPMPRSTGRKERSFINGVYTKMNLAIVGVDDARGHCLAPA